MCLHDEWMTSWSKDKATKKKQFIFISEKGFTVVLQSTIHNQLHVSIFTFKKTKNICHTLIKLSLSHRSSFLHEEPQPDVPEQTETKQK